MKTNNGHRTATTPPVVKQDTKSAFTDETTATISSDIKIPADCKIQVPEIKIPADFQIVVPEHAREYIDAYCDRYNRDVTAYWAMSADEREALPPTSRFRKTKGAIGDATNSEGGAQ